jgi:hypothetical protein
VSERARALARLLLIAPALALAPPPAAALVSATCDTFSSFDADGPGAPIVDSMMGPGSCASSVNEAPVSLNGDADADVGAFSARAEYVRTGTDPIDDASTYGRAQFRDTIVLSSPGLEGQSVTIRALAFVNGVLDVTGTGEAGVGLGILVSPGGSSQLLFEECRIGVACFGSFDPYPRFVSEVVEVSFDVVVGGSVTFGLSLTASAGHSGILIDAPGSALSSFGAAGDVGWGGISGVEQDGTPVPSFTITSESGTDWTQPVPEPGAASSAAAAALALGALSPLRRRRPVTAGRAQAPARSRRSHVAEGAWRWHRSRAWRCSRSPRTSIACAASAASRRRCSRSA